MSAEKKTHYVARVNAWKVEVEPNRDPRSASGDRRVKSEDVVLTVKAKTLEDLQKKVAAHLNLMDELEFERSE